MTPERFQEHWRTRHAELIVRLPGIRRYVQNFPLEADSAWDGIAESSFDDTAAMKALGTGWRRGVRWQDFEVANLPSGRPTLRLHGHLHKLKTKVLEPEDTVELMKSIAPERAQRELAELHRKAGAREALCDLYTGLWQRLQGAEREQALREYAELCLELGRVGPAADLDKHDLGFTRRRGWVDDDDRRRRRRRRDDRQVRHRRRAVEAAAGRAEGGVTASAVARPGGAQREGEGFVAAVLAERQPEGVDHVRAVARADTEPEALRC